MSNDEQQSEGQVSSAESLDPAQADQPIVPDQAVAGYPDSESGQPDEGPAGPNANPNKGEGEKTPGQRDPATDGDAGK